MIRLGCLFRFQERYFVYTKETIIQITPVTCHSIVVDKLRRSGGEVFLNPALLHVHTNQTCLVKSMKMCGRRLEPEIFCIGSVAFALCSSARHFTLTGPLSIAQCWGYLRWTSIPSRRVAVLLVGFMLRKPELRI